MVSYRLNTRLEDVRVPNRPLLWDLLLSTIVIGIMGIAVFMGLRSEPPTEVERQNCSHIDFLAGRCDHE